MHVFEREIAKREMLSITCSYSYQVIPISEQAKVNFGLFNKKRGPLFERIKDFLAGNVTDEKMQVFPYKGQISFYYDDPNETTRIEEVKNLVQWNMARYGIPGINYEEKNGSYYKSYQIGLSEGKDFKIEVGSKMVHKQPAKLTWDDIKTL